MLDNQIRISNGRAKDVMFSIVVAIIMIFTFALPQAVFADSSENSDDDDSTNIVYPERMKNRQTWEWFLSAPGLLVNLPFTITLKITEKIVSTVYQPQMVGWMYDITTSDDSTRAIRPAYGTRSGLGFKIYQKKLVNDESNIELSAKMGLNNRQKYQLKFEDFKIIEKRLYTDFTIGYRLLHDQEFYGYGPDTEIEDETVHAFERGWLEWNLHFSIMHDLKASTALTYDHNNVLRCWGDPEEQATLDVYDHSTLAGLEKEVRILGVLGRLQYDSRNSIGGPKRGQIINLSAGIYNQLEDDNYKFWKASFDFRQYIHLFAGRVFQLKFAGEMSEPLDDKRIPFYYLGELSWTDNIRGFENGRFHDYDMVMGSIEYRYPIWTKLPNTVDAFWFLDVGQVANDIFKDIDTDKFKYGYGGGFRVWNDFSESLNLVFAASKEEFRVYLEVNN